SYLIFVGFHTRVSTISLISSLAITGQPPGSNQRLKSFAVPKTALVDHTQLSAMFPTIWFWQQK
ncbi:MAG: hypothetical protein N6V49_06340, partial [Serratia symbiotica]|nr:hypothetical protein [Serratia symbiotica]